MTRVLALLVVPVALLGCAPKQPASAFRDTGTPIWSAAAFEPSRSVGTWRQVAGFQPAGAACTAGALAITPQAEGLRLDGTLCLAGVARDVSGLARPTGPGRLAVVGQEWWILWVDSDYRTLAIGTPSGRFGVLLDRAAIPGDRFNAAREVFDFNGYQTAAMTAF
ncbi:MAG: lipocalin [Pseudomonadota bacterium]